MTTADQLRQEAREAYQRQQESFDRCDTDGFLSQWASGMTGQLKMTQAEIEDNGGTETFPALFDLSGNLVPAKLVQTRYGMSWGLLPGSDPYETFTGWVSAFPKRASTMERKGYREGTVRAPAKAKVLGGGTGLSGAASAYVGVVRTDGGFSFDVEVIDNGQER